MTLIGGQRATYILPIRRDLLDDPGELVRYLRGLAGVEIIVVDGSDRDAFAALRSLLADHALHVAPASDIAGANGKVRGVLTGLRLARYEKVVVADDDVRYDRASLDEILRRLDRADVVRPQNFFSPAPWHALLDTSRTLINRALDGDWPGTLAFRKSALPNGYSADVLFENFELVRTIQAAGGTEHVARDLYVPRRPPTVSHFWSQRIRQAYDEFARPARLAAALAVVPAAVASVLCGWWSVPLGMAALAMVLAAIGWTRDNGRRYFSALAVIAAPLWLLERGICAWLAVYERFRYGGVRYGSAVIRAAASRDSKRPRWAF